MRLWPQWRAALVIVKPHGIAAFGTVWTATDTELERTVAVKIPRKEQPNATETESDQLVNWFADIQKVAWTTGGIG